MILVHASSFIKGKLVSLAMFDQKHMRRENGCPQFCVHQKTSTEKKICTVKAKQKPQHLGFPRGPPPWY